MKLIALYFRGILNLCLSMVFLIAKASPIHFHHRHHFNRLTQRFDRCFFHSFPQILFLYRLCVCQTALPLTLSSSASHKRYKVGLLFDMRCNDFIIETKPVIIDSFRRQVAKVEPLKLQVFHDKTTGVLLTLKVVQNTNSTDSIHTS